MALELGSLKKAVASLDRAWNFSQKRLAKKDTGPEEAEVIKAGVRPPFQYDYDDFNSNVWQYKSVVISVLQPYTHA
ncbi:MAG: hypothetical protein PVG90_14100, partial [Bacillota bacterium]